MVSRVLIAILVALLACGCCWRLQLRMVLSKAALVTVSQYYSFRPAAPPAGGWMPGSRPSSSYQVTAFLYRYILGAKTPQQTVQHVRAHIDSITSNNPVTNNLDLAEANVVRTIVPAPFADPSWDGDALWISWPGTNNSTSAPTIVWLHGGGIISGSAEGIIGLGQHLSRSTHMRVLSLNYRLCPEHPLPAASRDTIAAVRWLREDLGVERLVLGGGSGGGQLALLALQRMAALGVPPVSASVVLSPVVDTDPSSPLPSSALNRQRDHLLSPEPAETAMKLTCPNGYTVPDCSPMHGSWVGLPPMLLLAGGSEYLRDHAVLAYYLARDAGVKVRIEVEPNLGHVYPSYSGIGVAEGYEGVGKIASFIRAKAFGEAVDHLLRPLPSTVHEYMAQFGVDRTKAATHFAVLGEAQV